MKRTPISVIVLASIGIALACLGLFGTVLSELGAVMPSELTPGLNKDVGYVAVTSAACLLNLALYILLISASIGSIRLKPWARKGMIVYAIAELVLLVSYTIVSSSYLVPKMRAALDPKLPQDQIEMLNISFTIAPACGLLVAVYPIFVLVFFRGKKVVNAFNGIFPADPAALAPPYSPPPLPKEPDGPFP